MPYDAIRTADRGKTGIVDGDGQAFTMAQTSTMNAEGAVSVGATSTVVLAANADREYACLVNDSDEAIYLGLGQAAGLNAGVRLNANGGSYEITTFGNRFTGSINAICASGGKNLTYTEY